jgi:DNA-binding NarL/FixJ family response regulator
MTDGISAHDSDIVAVDKPHRSASSGAAQVALAEPDSARRVALGALFRQSRHVELAATLRDDNELLEWLASDARADVLMVGPAIRPQRVERYELLARARELRPDLPIVLAKLHEIAGAVRRAHGHADLSLVSARDELARVHEGLVFAARGRRYLSPRLQAVLDTSPLTERHVEILDRMAHGEARPEIARALGLSESTVRSHTKELYKRLGVNERAHAVAVGLRDVEILPPSKRSATAERRVIRAREDEA